MTRSSRPSSARWHTPLHTLAIASVCTARCASYCRATQHDCCGVGLARTQHDTTTRRRRHRHRRRRRRRRRLPVQDVRARFLPGARPAGGAQHVLPGAQAARASPFPLS